MNDRAIIWIWLQECIGFGNARMKAIFSYFEKPEDILMANERTLRKSRLFSESMIVRLLSKNLCHARKVYAECCNNGYRVIGLFDSEYPSKLRKLKDCPVVLYADGDIPNTENVLCTAIVGARSATEHSRKTAFDLGQGLSRNGNIVVSGGAVGIDTAAHQGALSSGGKTICVLGCGIDCNYLVANSTLRQNIAQNGAVISEYPPHRSTQKHTFLQRNRIIAGICNCTVVVQAGMKSGALDTADKTFKNHRKVFIIEGSQDDWHFMGSNALVDRGAEIITGSEEILEWYSRIPKKPPVIAHKIPDIITSNRIQQEISPIAVHQNTVSIEPMNVTGKSISTAVPKFTGHEEIVERNSHSGEKFVDENKILPEQLTENALMVYHTISGEPVDSDDVVNKTNLSVQEVKSAFTELEMLGLIKGTAGRGYIRK